MNQDVENAIGSFVDEPEPPAKPARPQRIYMVACYKPSNIQGKYGWANPSRMHVHGVYLSPENARTKCAEMNRDLESLRYIERKDDGSLRYKNHVISYKVRDAK